MTSKLQFSGDSKKDVSSKNICLEIIVHIEFQLNFKILHIYPLSILIHPASKKVSLKLNELEFIFFSRLSHLASSSTKIILIFTRILALKAHGDKGHTVNVQHKWNDGCTKGYEHLLISAVAPAFPTTYCLLYGSISCLLIISQKSHEILLLCYTFFLISCSKQPTYTFLFFHDSSVGKRITRA